MSVLNWLNVDTLARSFWLQTGPNMKKILKYKILETVSAKFDNLEPST